MTLSRVWLGSGVLYVSYFEAARREGVRHIFPMEKLSQTPALLRSIIRLVRILYLNSAAHKTRSPAGRG